MFDSRPDAVGQHQVPLASVYHPQAANPQTFEVASIKPNLTGGPATLMAMQPGGRFSATNVSFKVLMKMAYGLFPPWPGSRLPVTRTIGMSLPASYEVGAFEISGGPKWTDTDKFDIVVKADREVAPDEILLMLRQMLVDRFGLKSHHAAKEVQVYALRVVRGGAKLEAIPDDGSGEGGIGLRRSIRGAQIFSTKVALATFAKTLGDVLRHPVLDQTGVAGYFKIRLAWAPTDEERIGDAPIPSPPDTNVSGSSLFNAIQEQLGLRLESQRGPGDVLIIDRVDKALPN